MTIDQFIENLKAKRLKEDARFVLTFGNYIQIVCVGRGGMCPIEFLAGKFGAFHVREPLGLSEEDAVRIINAADNTDCWAPTGQMGRGTEYVVPWLRERLLEACGLENEKV